MARFNAKTKTNTNTTKTVNLAGGEAYSQSPKLEMISILLTSFVQDQYYKSSSDTLKTLNELLKKVDPKFAAKAAIYARNEFGMRSITHVLAAELAKYVSGQPWAKEFYNAVIHRPDDMSEILAYYYSKGNKALSKSMQRGFAKAFDKFDNYQLAKYKMENRDISLVDIVNLVHPFPTEKNSKGLDELINGTLKSTDTWEAKLSAAGQNAESEEEKLSLKKDAWKELIETRKIGYFALLKNLRNIIEQAPEVVTKACALLTDEKLIKNSLVLPFRFVTASEEIGKLQSSKETREVVAALNKALDISCANVPIFDGDTLVVLDDSGSMSGKPAQIGSLFASILVKSNNADLMTFSDNAKYRRVNIADSVLTIRDSIKFSCGGTNFNSIFQIANKKYDRIIILSDMQGWVGYHTPKVEFENYKRKTGANPHIYSFDLQGYGTMQFPEAKVMAVAGFSEKVFDVMKVLEQDKNALVNKIENYTDF